MVTKALQLAAQNEIQKGFSTEKLFVKSTSGEMPHVVTVSQNGSIKRDKSCKHFKRRTALCSCSVRGNFRRPTSTLH